MIAEHKHEFKPHYLKDARQITVCSSGDQAWNVLKSDDRRGGGVQLIDSRSPLFSSPDLLYVVDRPFIVLRCECGMMMDDDGREFDYGQDQRMPEQETPTGRD